MRKLHIVGIGPGSDSYIYPAARKIIAECDVLIGGKRNLEQFTGLGKEMLEVAGNLEAIYQYIICSSSSKRIAVLVTGDPGVYSLMGFLKAKLDGSDIELEVLPGISSLQYLCSRAQMSWNDMLITSVHGREQKELIANITSSKKIGIFTGGENSPGNICKQLITAGFTDARVIVGQRLSYPDEKIVQGPPEQIAGMEFDSLSVMIIQNDELCREKNIWKYETLGIPDTMFQRGEVPMTKEEVRAVSISKLRLEKSSIVWDVGAGTGSVAVECALKCKSGLVYAIERNEEGIGLIKRNAESFAVPNIISVHGEAPDALKGLPAPDRVFVGGTGGSMEETIGLVAGLGKALRVVVNAVTLESSYEALKAFEKFAFENIEIVSLSAARGRNVGGKHLMQALNPVYVISADRLSQSGNKE